MAVLHGEQKDSETDEIDGRYSPPPQEQKTFEVPITVPPVQSTKEKPPITVVGDVGGRIAIMIDNVIDDVASYVAAADVLREHGAYKIYVLATHGLLSSEAPRLIEESKIDQVIVTNTGLFKCVNHFLIS